MADSSQSIVEIIIKAIDETKEGLTQPIRNLNDLNDALSKLGPASQVAMGAFALAMEHGIKESLELAVQTARLSQEFGMSTEELSLMSKAFEAGGVEAGQMQAVFRGLSTAVVDAAAGTGKGAQAFQALGISVTNADGSIKSSHQLLGEIADRFKELPDGMEKSRIAVDLFGRSGLAMIPVLNKGAEGIQEYEDRARMWGAYVSGDLAAAGEHYREIMEISKMAGEGLFNQIGGHLNPILKDLHDQLLSLEPAGAGVVSVLASLFGQVFKAVYAGAIEVGSVILTVLTVIEAAANAAWKIVTLRGWQGLKEADAQMDAVMDMWRQNFARIDKLFDSDKSKQAGKESGKAAGEGVSEGFAEGLKEQAIKSSMRALNDAGAALLMAQTRSANKVQAAENEAAYQQGLMSLEDYSKQRIKTVQQENEQEVMLLRAKALALQAEAEKNKPEKDPNALMPGGPTSNVRYNELMAEIDKVNAQIVSKEADASAKVIQIQSETDAKRKQLDEQHFQEQQKLAENSVRVLQEVNKQAQADDDQRYKNGEISIDDYYNNAERRAKESAMAEIAVEQQKFEHLKELAAKYPVGSDQRKKLEAEAEALLLQIKREELALDGQLTTLEDKRAADSEKHAVEYRKLMDGLVKDGLDGEAALTAANQAQLSAQVANLRRARAEMHMTDKEYYDALAQLGKNFQKQLTQQEKEGAATRAELDAAEKTGDIRRAIQALNSEKAAAWAEIQGEQQYIKQYESFYIEAHRNMASYVAQAAQVVNQQLVSGLTDVITGAETASQFVKNLEKALVNMVVSFMVQRMVAWAMEKAMAAIGLGILETTGAASAMEAAGLAVAWAPAATEALVATFGGAGAAAAELPVLMATNSSAAMGLSAMGGIAGAAHGGLDWVPEESTFLLQKGEAVLSPNQNADLRAFLSSQKNGGAQRITVNLDGKPILDTVANGSRNGDLVLSARSVRPNGF